jgi:hypothetical protein
MAPVALPAWLLVTLPPSAAMSWASAGTVDFVTSCCFFSSSFFSRLRFFSTSFAAASLASFVRL